MENVFVFKFNQFYFKLFVVNVVDLLVDLFDVVEKFNVLTLLRFDLIKEEIEEETTTNEQSFKLPGRPSPILLKSCWLI